MCSFRSNGPGGPARRRPASSDPPSTSRPVGADEHKFKCRTTVVQTVQPIVHIVCVVHAHRFKSPSRPVSCAFSAQGRPSDLVSERAPLRSTIPLVAHGFTTTHRRSAASASRFILLNPPRSGFVHHPRSDSIRGSARDRLLADSVLVLRVYVTPPVLDLFVCALCVACLPPVTLCQQPTASFGRRRLQRKLPVSSVAPGRLPRLAAAGRRRAGRSVRFRKEIFCSTILLKIFPYIHRTHIHR